MQRSTLNQKPLPFGAEGGKQWDKSKKTKEQKVARRKNKNTKQFNIFFKIHRHTSYRKLLISLSSNHTVFSEHAGNEAFKVAF